MGIGRRGVGREDLVNYPLKELIKPKEGCKGHADERSLLKVGKEVKESPGQKKSKVDDHILHALRCARDKIMAVDVSDLLHMSKSTHPW